METNVAVAIERLNMAVAKLRAVDEATRMPNRKMRQRFGSDLAGLRLLIRGVIQDCKLISLDLTGEELC